MAQRKKAGEPSVPQSFDPDRTYKVKFRLPHARGRTKFSPIHSYRIRGGVLAEIPSQKIASAEPIA